MKIDLQKLKSYFRNLQNKGISTAEMKQKLNSVDNFVNWANKKGLLTEDKYKQLNQGIAEIRKKISSIFYRIAPDTWMNKLKKRWIPASAGMTVGRLLSSSRMRGSRNKTGFPIGVGNDKGAGGNDTGGVNGRPWFDISPSEFDLRHYIGISMILLVMAAMGAAAYNQFFKEASTPFAFPANLTKGGRTLSFQGRLTDSLGNPISTATNLKFKLYNASTGGTTLYDSTACSLTPDQDGVFDVLIGGSAYSPTPPQDVCGTEIPENIFSDWPNVYLGVTIGSDAEAVPRQQIANVGYAINAETLKGFPPGTGFSNIPYINSDGNIIIATSAAGIRNSWASTNFTLSSTGTITVQSAGTGDVALTATESGNITATTGLGTTLFNVLTGNLKVGNGAPGVSLDGEDAYIEGTLEVDAGTTLDGSLTANGTLTLGDGGDTVAINSSDWDIDSSGNASGIGTIISDGKLTVNVAGLAAGIQNTSDAAANQIATFGSGNRVTPTNNDEGYFSFLNDDSTGTQIEFSRLTWAATDVINTSKDSEIQFDVQSNNTLTKILSVQGSGIDIVGEVDFSGLLVAGSSSVTLTDSTGYVLHDALVDCADTEILKWSTGGSRWGCATDAGGGGSWSDLTVPTANLSLAHAGYTTAFTFDSVTASDAFALSSSSLTTGTILDLSSTSTAGGVSGLSKVLDITRSGTNANASHTAYGLYSAVTNTGTTSTNIGGYFSASGATNNYGLIVENGNVGIGTIAPAAKTEVLATTEQLRLSYDANNRSSFTVNSAGNLTVDNYHASADTTLTVQNSDGTGVSNLSVEGQIRVGQSSASPTALGSGSLYYDSDDNKLYLNNGSSWNGLGTNTFFSNNNAAIASGSYLEVAHNQNSNDLVANGWVYNTNSSQYQQTDITDTDLSSSTTTANFNTEGNYSQENMAYAVTLTPSATTGDITLTLGSGNWNTDSRVLAGCRVAGNGGVATLTAAPAAQTTITATTTTDFTDTSAIASGSWYLYCTTFDGSVVKLNSYQSTTYVSDVGTFATTSQGQLPAIRRNHNAVTTSIGGTQYIYVIGGYDTAGRSTVYKATIDASGNVGTFATTSQGQLPAIRYFSSTVTATIGGTQYIYVTGGFDTVERSTVYKATVDSSGNIGAFATTSQGQLPAGTYRHNTVTTSIGGTQYMYVTGGEAVMSTVYKATIDSSGNVGTFATTSQGQLPVANNRDNSTVIAEIGGTQYMYVIGAIATSTVYKATIDSSGNIGTFATTSQGQLPTILYQHSTVTASIGGTQYMYVTGGVSASTVYKTTVDSSGNIGTFATTSQGQLPAIRGWHSTVTASIGGIGYIYVTGGNDGATNFSNVYKATIGPDTGATYTPTSTYYTTVTSTDQIDASSFNDLNSVTVTETLNSQTINYAVSFDNRTIFRKYDITTDNSGWRPIARNNSGTWQYNSNASAGYSNVTWTSSTVNAMNAAISQAQGVASNNMTGTQLNALTDLQWNEQGGYTSLVTKLDFSASLYTTSASQIPEADQIKVNYTKSGYKLVQFDANTTRLYNYTDNAQQLRLDVATASYTSNAWSTITSPVGNLGLSMGAYTTTFTYDNATSTNNLFNLTDTTSNTGTGYLMNLTTASGSTLNPLHVSAAGVEALIVNSSGKVGIGDTTPLATLTVGDGDLFQVAGATGDITTAGDIAVNGGNLTTSSTAFDLINTTATTVNFARAGTTIGIGASTGTLTLNNATIKADGIITSSSTKNLRLEASGAVAGDGNNGSIYFLDSGGTTRARLDTTTPVGTATSTIPYTTESNYSQENMAYSVTLTPSATSGDITLTLGSGNWNTDARVLAGCRVTGNGGVASFTAAPAAQTTITATTTTNFTNTNAIASGSWYLYCTTFDGSVVKLNTYQGLTYVSDVGTFATTSQAQLPDRYRHSTVTASIGGTQYMYVTGGYVVSTVYKAVIDSSGNVGTFATTSQGQLPATNYYHSTVTASIGGTQYMYVTGGNNISTVYKATIDASGNVGAFATTSQGQLPALKERHSTVTAEIGGTQYMYVTGGQNASTVYKATIDASGNVGAFATTSQGQLPALREFHSTVTASIGGTQYIYVIGGVSASTVYKAVIDSSGNVGAFATTSQGQLPEVRQYFSTVTTTIGGTQYIYVTGGFNGTVYISTVYKATIDASGNVGAFATTSQGQLPAKNSFDSTVTATIGGTQYIYVTGGFNGSAIISTVYKATIGPDTLTAITPTSTYYTTVTSGDQINTTSWYDVDSAVVTETLNSQVAYYSFSFDGRTTFSVYDGSGAAWRNIARNNAGTWEYNSNAVYASTTWTSATKNAMNAAISQAMGTAVNRMTGTIVAGMTGTMWQLSGGFVQATTTTVDTAVSLYTTSATQIPQTDNIAFSYITGYTTLYAGGLDASVINADGGNLGIGTLTPESKVQITGGGLCVGSDANCNTDNNTEGTVYAATTAMTVYDVAENYPTKDTTLVPAEVVELDPENGVFVRRSSSNSPYSQKLLGIISTEPGVLLGGFNGQQFKEEHQVAVALSGRVPVKIASTSENIKVGDFLTSSSEPGKAMKAVKAGYTIGKALESWEPCASVIPDDSSVIPVETGIQSGLDPLLRGDDGGVAGDDPTNCGASTIEVFVNLGYYEPEIYLTNTGEIKIIKQMDTANSSIEASESASLVYNNIYENTVNSLKREIFSLQKSSGEIINRIGTYAEIITGKIKTGLLEAENAVINNTLFAKKIISPVIETDILTVNQVASIKNLETSEIRPQDKDVVIDLSGQSSVIPSLTGNPELDPLLRGDDGGEAGDPTSSETSLGVKGELAKFIIKGINNIKAVEIDSLGNATFSGTLTSAKVETSEASISGKLIAKEIESENITQILNQVEDDKLSIQNSKGRLDEQGNSINDIQKFLADLQNQPVSNVDNYQDAETMNNLNVTGDTSLYNVFISNTLTSGNLLLEDNKIMSLDFELKLTALSSINLLDGQVIISKTGGLTTKGPITALAGIKTNKIEPLNPDENVFIQNLETNKIQISNKYLDATTSASIITALDNFEQNGLYSAAIKTQAESAGIGIIKRQDEEITIYNDSIKKDSLVYLTPTINTNSNVLSVTEKEGCGKVEKLEGGKGCKPYFKVATSGQRTNDVKFNWLIIN